jgi:hypothetical protein
VCILAKTRTSENLIIAFERKFCANVFLGNDGT